jgi:hypothetical protein
VFVDLNGLAFSLQVSTKANICSAVLLAGGAAVLEQPAVEGREEHLELVQPQGVSSPKRPITAVAG